jgi:peptidoglycan-associated lipoprotein
MRNKASKTARLATALAALVVMAALATGCACTRPDCQLGISSPTEGQRLPPGDVDVTLTPQRGSFCAFPARSYEVRLDDGAPVAVPAGDGALVAHFTGVVPGTHTARAAALDSLGRPLGTASVTFIVEAPAPPPPPPTPVPTPAPPPPTDGIDEMNRRGYLKDVFFDFDKYNIRPDQRGSLEANATWLRANPGVRVTVEGHCDERGTRQYNLALGERRASSTKDYLVNLGIEASRIETISYGEDRPFDPGHDEAAWAKNRRGHFVITAKGGP